MSQTKTYKKFIFIFIYFAIYLFFYFIINFFTKRENKASNPVSSGGMRTTTKSQEEEYAEQNYQMESKNKVEQGKCQLNVSEYEIMNMF